MKIRGRSRMEKAQEETASGGAKENATRRQFLKYVTAAIGGACPLTPAIPASGATKKAPTLNIVLIISDDHGWRDARCYGNRDTSSLSRLYTWVESL